MCFGNLLYDNALYNMPAASRQQAYCVNDWLPGIENEHILKDRHVVPGGEQLDILGHMAIWPKEKRS